MRYGSVYYKDQVAGVLSQLDNGCFHFSYDPTWLMDPRKPSISLTLPKAALEFESASPKPASFFDVLTQNKELKYLRRRLKEFQRW